MPCAQRTTRWSSRLQLARPPRPTCTPATWSTRAWLRHAKARCPPVTDIHRGASGASVRHSGRCRPRDERALDPAGFVLNKFRGDAGAARARAADAAGRNRRACRGHHPHAVAPRPAGRRTASSIQAPHARGAALSTTRSSRGGLSARISNLDEFQPLTNVPGVRLRGVCRAPAGSKAD